MNEIKNIMFFVISYTYNIGFLLKRKLLSTKFILLKVPKCEIFRLFDFNDFYGIKSL
jgi:hypothetical protein